MAFTIQYNTPTEVQTGPIRVIIDFTNDEDNSSLYVSNVNSSHFELINEAGETIPSSTYTLEVCTLAKLNNRQLNISFFSGSGSFRIKTSANASLIGSRNPYPTHTTSDNISLNDPQTSRSIIYKVPPTDTSSTPSSTPEPLDPQDQVPEPDPESGPEQTQFLAAVEVGQGSGSPEGGGGEINDPEPDIELVVHISHLPPGVSEALFETDLIDLASRIQSRTPNDLRRIVFGLRHHPNVGDASNYIINNELTIYYTWMTRYRIPVPVVWGGPNRVWAVGQDDDKILGSDEFAEALIAAVLGDGEYPEETSRIGRLPKVYNVLHREYPVRFLRKKFEFLHRVKGLSVFLLNHM